MNKFKKIYLDTPIIQLNIEDHANIYFTGNPKITYFFSSDLRLFTEITDFSVQLFQDFGSRQLRIKIKIWFICTKCYIFYKCI